MNSIKQIENSLSDIFKGLPPLPSSTKETLAKIWPWLALIGGIIQLLAAWGLYQLTNYVNRINDLANSLSAYYTGQAAGLSSTDKMVIYLSIAVLVVDAVLLLMAYPHLKTRSRRGWDLLFLASLINLVYAVLQIFTYNRGFGSFIGSLIGSAIGFYLLFQVREKYGSKKTAS